jgi:heat shock protein 5
MRTFSALGLTLALVIAFASQCTSEDVVSGKGSVKGPVMGIDLGTTYSCVGVYKNGRVEIVQNDQGNRITPSVVAFTTEGRLIGDAAKNQAALNPTNTVYDAKRLIGRTFYDDSVQGDAKHWPFEIVNKDGKPHIQVEVDGGTKTFAAEEISSMVLTKMRKIAEEYLGSSVNNAVVTCPAYFNDQQRAATKDAGAIASLKVLRVINEPTAAALAYGLDRADQSSEQNILVFDLGGGTFDVTVLTIEKGVFEVASTNGDTHLGGEDFDQRIMAHLMKVFKKKHKKDMSGDKRAIQKLKREAERAKRTLSSNAQTRIEIEALFDNIDFSETLTRAKFEEMNLDLFKKTMKPVKKALEDSRMSKSDIDEVVLVGGSTRIPKVQQLLSNFFNGKELNQDINPDEAVAYGATVQGGILSGEGGEAVKDVILLDVAPLSMGVETEDGLMSKIIDRNSVIPTKKTQEYTTVQDNQQQVNFQVYEGERSVAKNNHLLGSFTLENIPAAKKNVPKIDVSFDIDQNGILKVSAVEKAGGSSAGVTITNDQNRLTKDQIDQMVSDGDKYAEDDKQAKLSAEASRELREYLDTQKDFPGLDKLKMKDRRKHQKAVEAAYDFLKTAQGGGEKVTAVDIRAKLRETEAVCSPITALLYDGGDAKDEDDGDVPDDDARADEL